MKFFKNILKNFPKDRLTQILLGAVLLLAIVGSVYSFNLVRHVVATNQTFLLPGDPVLPAAETIEGEDPEILPTEYVPPASLPAPEPWDGVSRVNFLVMGLDYRDWEAGDTPRTDTMMVLTYDPVNHTAGMLSIPRDLWVPIPGFEYHRINTAYYLAEVYNMPGGGPALAAKTVEELLGVPIHYYAQIDFQAFVDFIDHIGGVKITLEEEMVLDRRGRWNTRVLEAGTYTLDGEFSLAYVRARKTEGGDFDRAGRQQNFVMALRSRILEFDLMPTLVANAPQIFSDLSSGIRTNMTLNDAIKLAWSAMDVNPRDISTAVITNEYVTLATSEDDMAILRPVPDRIRLLRDEIFGISGSLGPVATGDISELIGEEGARVSLRNGSSYPGLASSTADWLRDQGFNIVEEANADYTVYSQVYVYQGTPYTLRGISEILGLNANNIHYRFDLDAGFDLIVVLGDDWGANNPMP